MGSPRLHLRLSAAAEREIRAGHPWVFSDSIRGQSREGAPGEFAVIYDRRDRFLAIGLYDPDSPIRVRILHQGNPVQISPAWWAQKLSDARERRREIDSPRTTGFRWIHGESDSFPGLVLDRYDQTLVMKLYSGIWLPRLEETVELFRAVFHPERLVIRLSRNIQSAARTKGLEDGQVLAGTAPGAPVLFLENGVQFEADVIRGQKTGFFLDQRENRARVERLAPGREVLNAFSFSGGFSVYAARGGARRVVDLDISAHALESSRRHFALNEAALRGCSHECIQADAFEWLAEREGRPAFDLLILDPPALAKKASDKPGALAAYARLARCGASLLRSGGILVIASCSAQVTSDEFFSSVNRGFLAAGVRLEELERTGQPADHPAAFPEAAYLKAGYFRRPGRAKK